MDKYILLVITSVTSIIVALISLYFNLRNNSKLEVLKFELEKKKSFFKLFDDNYKNRFSSLGNHIKSIQKSKDYLSFLLNTTNASLRSKIAKEGFQECVDNMLLTYESESIFLDIEDNEIAHSAKNLIFNLVFELDVICNRNENFEFLNDEKERFLFLKTEIGNVQNQLRDIRYNIISETK